MFVQVSDETSLALFAGISSEYKGLTISDFDIVDWHRYADVLNVVKLRDDMLEHHVAFKDQIAYFGLQHVQAVYHRNGLGLYESRVEQIVQNRITQQDVKKSRVGRRQRSSGCSACKH
jgi:hypothetical protein